MIDSILLAGDSWQVPGSNFWLGVEVTVLAGITELGYKGGMSPRKKTEDNSTEVDRELAAQGKRLYFWMYAEKLIPYGFTVSLKEPSTEYPQGRMEARCRCGKRFNERLGFALQHVEKCAEAIKFRTGLGAARLTVEDYRGRMQDYRGRMPLSDQRGQLIPFTTTDPATGKQITLMVRVEDVLESRGAKH